MLETDRVDERGVTDITRVSRRRVRRAILRQLTQIHRDDFTRAVIARGKRFEQRVTHLATSTSDED